MVFLICRVVSNNLIVDQKPGWNAVVMGATTLPKILKGYYATQVRKKKRRPVVTGGLRLKLNALSQSLHHMQL